MFHYLDTITNTKGDSLPGWQVECVLLSDGSTVVDIYADENGTPIASVSGVTNRAISDAEGNYDFFVDVGDYSLRFYSAEGIYQRLVRYVNMTGATSVGGVPEATGANVWSGVGDEYVSPDAVLAACTPVALTSSATITPDFAAGANFTLTLAHNTTLANPSNMKPGLSCGTITITQDGTGSRTMAYGSKWKFPGGAQLLSTDPAAIDVISYQVISSTLIYATIGKGLAS
jgi:hypothetical protein